MRIVFIMSTNYAGSTVLGLILGNHPRMDFLGEPVQLFAIDDSGGWRHSRWCTMCGDDAGSACPRWNASMVERLRSADRRKAWTLLGETSPAEVLIDSSKNISWVKNCLDAQEFSEVQILHLTKSVEPYMASTLLHAGQHRGRALRLQLIAGEWAQQNDRIADFASSRRLPYLHVTYDDLVTQPDETLERLAGFVNFKPVDDQLEFWSSTQHYVKGNPGVGSTFRPEVRTGQPALNQRLYEDNDRTIFKDLKWRTVLRESEVRRARNSFHVRKTSRRFGYQLRRPPLRQVLRPDVLALDAVAACIRPLAFRPKRYRMAAR